MTPSSYSCGFWNGKRPFPCRQCSRCLYALRRHLFHKIKNTHFEHHFIVIAGTISMPDKQEQIDRMLKLLDQARQFRREASKRILYPWDYYAKPEINPCKDGNTWNCHIHLLLRGVQERDITKIRGTWKMLKCRIKRVCINNNEHYIATSMYIATKHRRLFLGHRKQEAAKSRYFFKFYDSHEFNHEHKKALIRLIKAFWTLLDVGVPKELTNDEIAFEAARGTKFSGKASQRMKDNIVVLTRMKLIYRRRRKKNEMYTYWLQPPEQHRDELKTLIEEMQSAPDENTDDTLFHKL